MMAGTIIHRDQTFLFDDETWHVQRGGPRGSGDEAYQVYRDSDGMDVLALFDRLSDVREYVDECRANDWPLIPYMTVAEASDRYKTNAAGVWELVHSGFLHEYRPTENHQWRFEERQHRDG